MQLFHFVLGAIVCVFVVELFFFAVIAWLVFEIECLVPVGAEALGTEDAVACEALFPRAALLRTCVTGASFTGSATASVLPGFTAFDDR